MKKNLMFIAFAIVIATLVSCDNYGTKLTFDSTDVYYTDEVTEAEAQALGEFLQESDFTDGDDTKTVQLTKDGDTYQFRMVVKEGYEDDEDYELIAQYFAFSISEEVFDGEEVEIHLCDDELKTLKVVEMESIVDEDFEMLEFDGTEIQYDETVTKAEVKAVGDYLEESGFTDGTTKSVILIKEYDVYVFKMVSSEEYWDDEEFLETVKGFAVMISENALDNETVEIQLCDDLFEAQAYVSMY
jgi:hypothetical protein